VNFLLPANQTIAAHALPMDKVQPAFFTSQRPAFVPAADSGRREQSFIHGESDRPSSLL